MPDREFTATDLIALLERVPLATPARSLAGIRQAKLELTLARVASLTDALRGAEPTDASRVAARLLLADLADVAAQFRTGIREISDALTSAADGLHAVASADGPSDKG